MTLRITIAAALLAAAIGLVACGGDDDDTPAPAERRHRRRTSPTPTASKLLQVLNAADGEGPVISPSGTVYNEGDNRYAFGVFDIGGAQITDADVALYAAPGKDGEAEGPFPASIEDLERRGPVPVAGRPRSTRTRPRWPT